jgi:hypothetical protein
MIFLDLALLVHRRVVRGPSRSQEGPMSRITYRKRQREMKRLDKQRMKADRRAQKKLAKNAGSEVPSEFASMTPKSDPSN